MARTSGRAAQTWNNMTDSSWLELIARFGYGAVGVLYLLIGLLALKLATGTESRAPDAQRVIVKIGAQPYGKWLLGIIAGGLLAFAIWRFMQAISDPYEVGSGVKGMIARAGYILSGLLYGTLAIFGIELIFEIAMRFLAASSGKRNLSMPQQPGYFVRNQAWRRCTWNSFTPSVIPGAIRGVSSSPSPTTPWCLTPRCFAPELTPRMPLGSRSLNCLH